MPDKQDDNKIMKMLERRGLVRKVDEEDPAASATDEVARQPETGAAPAPVQAQNEQPRVTPAARQPVPGIQTPVMPSGQQSPAMAAQQPQPARMYSPERAPVNQFPGGIETINDSAQWDEGTYAAPDGSRQDAFSQQPAENYTDRYLDIDELYEALSLKSKRTETIYLVEEYIRALPESLPDESRRDIVSKIISASGFDYDILMGDGVLRVKMLKEYAELFSRYTDEYVTSRQAELEELEQQIVRTSKLIENRRELHKQQFFAIETEAQRLKEILTFISG